MDSASLDTVQSLPRFYAPMAARCASYLFRSMVVALFVVTLLHDSHCVEKASKV